MNGTYSSKCVLVTGGAGFLGSHLIDFLLEKGHRVIGVDSFETGSPRNLEHLRNNPRFTLINHNIQNPLHSKDVEEVDQIYNLACPASPIQYQKDHLGTLKTCFLGTENLLQLAKCKRIRILHTSTSEVYGDPLVHPQAETYWGNVNPHGPRSCYDEGKRVAESLCYAFREQFDVEVRIARIFNTYGPRMGAGDGRVVSNFVSSALTGQSIRVTGDGSTTRSFQFVSDCVNGLHLLMNSTYNAGPVNIGNDTESSIQTLAETVVKLVAQMTHKPEVAITFHPSPADDPLVRCPRIELAKAQLGWMPIVDLETGLRKTIEWHMQEAGLS
ncbi:UDP-glucuronic acid decarboxylase 1 [Penicillium macrosclerotiorum]|uniref:UDP-glucuronic acid decarboxylase 1 n=1 Tax=Penicillium macrosclerotiorum TaxID=303699 RepID=UPI002549A3C7|nr:UDP-glucuronic acid decarboxylase 1 [Penicillium macrosclerotiorum]KAJ5692144.1 UDP-glucuronic acid decarboxylase 1 [Penicillium macrosclerotiorum]